METIYRDRQLGATRKEFAERKAVYIYILSDPITFQIKYVGKTKNPGTRLRSHINESCRKTNRKCQWIASLVNRGVSPEFEIIEECPDDETSTWIDAERFWIAHLREVGAPLLNFSEGGEMGPIGSEEHSKLLSERLKGRKRSPAAVAKMVATNTGKRCSPEQKAQMSLSAKNRPGMREHLLTIQEKAREKTAGVPLSAEHKKNISEALKGRIKTPDEIEKSRQARKGKSFSAEARARMSEGKRRFFDDPNYVSPIVSPQECQRRSSAAEARWANPEFRAKMEAVNARKRSARLNSPESIRREQERLEKAWQREAKAQAKAAEKVQQESLKQERKRLQEVQRLATEAAKDAKYSPEERAKRKAAAAKRWAAFNADPEKRQAVIDSMTRGQKSRGESQRKVGYNRRPNPLLPTSVAVYGF